MTLKDLLNNEDYHFFLYKWLDHFVLAYNETEALKCISEYVDCSPHDLKSIRVNYTGALIQTPWMMAYQNACMGIAEILIMDHGKTLPLYLGNTKTLGKSAIKCYVSVAEELGLEVSQC